MKNLQRITIMRTQLLTQLQLPKELKDLPLLNEIIYKKY